MHYIYIYSRKVEYLHELVLNTLSLLSDRRNGEKEDNVTSNNEGGDDFVEEDKDECMLILDDELKIGKNIDLVEDEECQVSNKKLLPSIMGNMQNARNSFRMR